MSEENSPIRTGIQNLNEQLGKPSGVTPGENFIATTVVVPYTLSIIKGPSVARGHAENILTYITRSGWTILFAKQYVFTPDSVREFYHEHVDKPYFANVEKVMCDPAGNVAFIAQPNGELIKPVAPVWKAFRDLVGPSSNPDLCPPQTIRGVFSGRWWDGDPTIYADNAIHASDSDASVEREISILYPERVTRHG